MAHYVPPGEGMVLELGPGAGAVTAALLRHGVHPRDLVLVERSEAMCAVLARRFPGVDLVRGDAANLVDVAAPRKRHIRAIVSSLPLRSLPRPLVGRILEQMALVSSPGTMLIQFSYALHGRSAAMAHGFEHARTEVIWRNVPPARVDALRYGGRRSD